MEERGKIEIDEGERMWKCAEGEVLGGGRTEGDGGRYVRKMDKSRRGNVAFNTFVFVYFQIMQKESLYKQQIVELGMLREEEKQTYKRHEETQVMLL